MKIFDPIVATAYTTKNIHSVKSGMELKTILFGNTRCEVFYLSLI